MKTLEQIYERAGKSECLDSRDVARLLDFIPVSDWQKFGFKAKDGTDADSVQPIPYTEENILKKLESDLAFAFDKALGQRGISSSLMFHVIKMWVWVMDDEELMAWNDLDYAQYGFPFLKAVAVKYGFPNPIGEDNGNESKYATD